MLLEIILALRGYFLGNTKFIKWCSWCEWKCGTYETKWSKTYWNFSKRCDDRRSIMRLRRPAWLACLF